MCCFKHKYKAKSEALQLTFVKAKSEALQLTFVIMYCFKHKCKAKSDQEFTILFKTIDNESDIEKFQFSP